MPWPIMRVKNVGIKKEATDLIELPPLKELIAPNGTVIGDISWMLDFAIIAFPKSGTTFMKDYLNETGETYVYEREFCIKRYSQVSDFVQTYYKLHVKLNQPKQPKTIRFGLKCPGVFYRTDDIHIYAKYFPHTKFIVGLRHPISWFESFYNYQSYRNVSLPNTLELIGKCQNHGKVCTDRARFHAALARLGKTPMQSDKEIALLFGLRYSEQQYIHQTNNHQNESDPNHRDLKQNGFSNEVFLYELRQIHNKAASKELASGIQQYIGLRDKLPTILSYKQTKPRAINICDDEHETARKLLAEHGTDARTWIVEYFLPSLSVSSTISFHSYLNDWGTDPCLNNTFS